MDFDLKSGICFRRFPWMCLTLLIWQTATVTAGLDLQSEISLSSAVCPTASLSGCPWLTTALYSARTCRKVPLPCPEFWVPALPEGINSLPSLSLLVTRMLDPPLEIIDSSEQRVSWPSLLPPEALPTTYFLATTFLNLRVSSLSPLHLSIFVTRVLDPHPGVSGFTEFLSEQVSTQTR